MMSMKDYVQRYDIRVEGEETSPPNDPDFKNARAFDLTLIHGASGRRWEHIPWRQGHAIEEEPQEAPWRVLGALVDDAAGFLLTRDLDDFAAEYGFEKPSEASDIYAKCREVAAALVTFLGSRSVRDYLLFEVDRT